MKELRICEYCGHEYYVHESFDQECCSKGCGQRLRKIKSQQNKVKMTPIDIFLNQNNFEENYDNDEVNAIASVMDIDEYDDIYGLPEGESISWPRHHIYQEMNKHIDAIIVLYECPHHTSYTKHRHHPDYNKPLEIELLCRRCHNARHKEQKKIFNFTFSKRSLTAPAVVVATPEASIFAAGYQGASANTRHAHHPLGQHEIIIGDQFESA